MSAKNSPLIRIVAYQPDIAQNLGNMIRSCACFAVPLCVIEPCGFAFSIKALRRSAMDYVKIAEIEHELSWEHYKSKSARRKVLLSSKAKSAYTSFEFQAGDDLILGRESAGVPDEVAADCDEAVTIPMPGGGRSLNVAVSGAVVMAEALRQLGRI